MLIQARKPQHLADIFYSAPFDPDGWDKALKGLAALTGSRCAQLIAIGNDRHIPFNITTDPEPGFVEEFAQIDGGNKDVNWRVAASRPWMEVRWERHYDEARKRIRSEIYDEFADRYDLPFGCQTVLYQNDEVFYGLAALRARREGRTTASMRTMFEKTAPHVVAAIKLQLTLEHRGAMVLAGALDVLDKAAFVLDCAGKHIAHSAAADDLMSRGIGLRVSRGRLSADDPRVDRLLQQAIASALTHTSQEDPPPPKIVQPFWLGTTLPQAFLGLCEVLPLPSQDWNFGQAPCVIVTVKRPEELGADRKAPIKALLGLTDAEAEVALMTANGLSRECIANERSTTESTVTSQFKQIFHKAGVRRESELVALINRLMR